VFLEALKSFHQLQDSDVRAVVDELMISLSGISPAPCIGEGVELRLAHRAAWLAEENIVIRVRVKRRIEIDKIDTRIRKLAPVAQPFQIVAEIHCRSYDYEQKKSHHAASQVQPAQGRQSIHPSHQFGEDAR